MELSSILLPSPMRASSESVMVNNFAHPIPQDRIEGMSSLPPRTKRVEMPAIGVEDILAFDWKAFMDGGNNSAGYVAPADRADVYMARKEEDARRAMAEVPDSSKDTSLALQAEAKPQNSMIDVLTQNIAEIRDSIKELKDNQIAPQVQPDHAKVVSDALLALTKTASRKRPASALMQSLTEGCGEDAPCQDSRTGDKKKIRMQRNRQSAHESRERKRLYTEQLEGKVQELTTKNTELETTCQLLTAKVSKMESELSILRHPQPSI